MGSRNNHWYNINEARAYPLDDSASLVSDSGGRLPAGLLEDLRIRWPRSLGRWVFLSAATITTHIVTFTFEVTDSMDAVAGQSQLLAGFSMAIKDLMPGRTYNLQTFATGVAGYVVIGSSTDAPFQGKFSTPRQSLVTPRAGRFYRDPPIPSMKLHGSELPLTGLIKLTAKEPLTIERATRVIDGVEYDNVIVFKLKDPVSDVESDKDYVPAIARFASPCTGIVTMSCTDPQPVLSVNGVTPDCQGRVYLRFRGAAVVGKVYDDDSALIIGSPVDMATTCAPPYLPSLADGTLPSYTDPVDIPIPPDPEIPPVDPESISEVFTTVMSLPHCETFDYGIAPGFAPTENSEFGFIADDSPEEDFCCAGPPPSTSDICWATDENSQSMSDSLSLSESAVFAVASSYGTVSEPAQSKTNIALFTLDVQSLYRKYTTDVKVLPGIPGSKSNVGIIFNYKTIPLTGLLEYWLLKLDVAAGVFGLYYFNGLQLVPLGAVATLTGLRLEDWYRLTLTIVPDTETQTQVFVTATCRGIYDPGLNISINTTISSAKYMPDGGYVGLHVDRSKALFSFWRVEEADV